MVTVNDFLVYGNFKYTYVRVLYKINIESKQESNKTLTQAIN